MMSVRGADYPRIKHDHYQTPVEVVQTLLDHCRFYRRVVDPACGKEKRIVKTLKKNGYEAHGDDLNLGTDFIEQGTKFNSHRYDIVTNPPYGDRRGTLGVRFIEKALQSTKRHHGKVAMLLPADFDSAKTRTHIFGHPAFSLKLVLLDRIKWFDGKSGATNFAWYVWDWKHKGAPTIGYARIES